MILRGKLYIGDRRDADTFRGDAIVSLGSSDDSYRTREGIAYLRIVIDDAADEEISKHFEAVSAFIQQHLQEGHAVLVHCYAGISRSATVCIAYLMKYRDLSLGQAYCVVQKARDIIYPNEGFYKQLQAYEKKLFSGEYFM
jgi:protein-tyrosine phosphatase